MEKRKAREYANEIAHANGHIGNIPTMEDDVMEDRLQKEVEELEEIESEFQKRSEE